MAGELEFGVRSVIALPGKQNQNESRTERIRYNHGRISEGWGRIRVGERKWGGEYLSSSALSYEFSVPCLMDVCRISRDPFEIYMCPLQAVSYESAMDGFKNCEGKTDAIASFLPSLKVSDFFFECVLCGRQEVW